MTNSDRLSRLGDLLRAEGFGEIHPGRLCRAYDILRGRGEGLRVSGQLEIFRRERGGPEVCTVRGPNKIITNGLDSIAQLFGGPAFDPGHGDHAPNFFAVGTGGADGVDDPTSPTELNNFIYEETPVVSFTPTGLITFEMTLEDNEPSGQPYNFNEAGLMARNSPTGFPVIAYKGFADQSKTSSVSLTFRWKVTFTYV